MSRSKQDHPLEWMIALLLGGMLCLGPLLFGGVYASGQILMGLLAGGALVCWGVLILLGKGYRLLWPPICWVVLAFMLFAIWHMRSAEVAYAAQSELFRIFLYGAVFLMAVNFLHGQETTQMLSLVLVFLGMLVASYAIVQYITHSNLVWNVVRPPNYANRGSGTYICPNHLAGFLEMVLPLGLAYLFAGRMNTTFKVFLGYACLVIMTGIGVSMSRGGWIATGISIMAFLVLLLGNRRYRIQASAALLFLLVAGYMLFDRSDALKERVQETLRSSEVTQISVRPLIWDASWRMFKDHSIIGVGPGQFDHSFQYYRHPEVQERPGWVHNDFLQLLVEYGLIGGGFVAIGLVLLAVGAWSTRKYVQREAKDFGKNRHSNRAAFVLGGSISLLAIAVHSLVDFNLYIPANGLLACVLAGMLVSHVRFATERFWWKNRWPNRVIAGALVLLLLGMIGSILPSRYQEWRSMRQARLATPYSSERIELLVDAWKAEPSNYETAYQIGETLLQLGRQFGPGHQQQLDAAIQWFEKSIEAWPGYPYPYVMIGICLDSLLRREEATPYFDRALALDPKNHFALAYRGWHELERGDKVAALDYFKRSFQIRHYDNLFAYHHIRLLKRELNDPEPFINPDTGEPFPL